MPDSPEYLIADILPANEVHLLGGSSGSGKTTFLFQLLADWQAGRPVLGHASNPVPYAYISIDRSRTSVGRTLQRLNLGAEITRIVTREDLPTTISLSIVIEQARTVYPDSQCFFIEGFQTLVGDKGNSYTDVARLLAATTSFCAKEGITIVGICHSPKLKIEEGFQHPREMLLGSVAWAAFSDTIIIMDLDEKTKIVNCHVLPRNAASETHPFKFTPPNGRLAPPKEEDFDPAPKKLLINIVLNCDEGLEITKRDLVAQGEELGISLRTVERIITALMEEGELESTTMRGVYRRKRAKIN